MLRIQNVKSYFSIINEHRNTDQFLRKQPFTPGNLIKEITNQITVNTDSKIAVMFTVEWALYFKLSLNVNSSNITVITDKLCNITKRHCELHGFKYIILDEALEQNMKFDVVVGNPPYDRSIKSNYKLPFTNIGPHSAFTEKSHRLLKDNGLFSFVLPCNFMCLPSGAQFRKWVLNNFNITNINLYDNGKKEIFNINLSDILVITGTKLSNNNTTANTNIIWTFNGKSTFTVNLTKYDIWPMYKSKASVIIFDSVMKSKIRELEYKGNTPSKYFISGNLTRLGSRQNPNPQLQFSKGIMKNISYPIWLGYSSNTELDFQYEWLGTNHYAYILSLVQSTTKNQPILFSIIGEHNFKSNDFANHFNITADLQEEIDNWHQELTFKG